MGEHNIRRGLKWKGAIELATLQHRDKDIEWFNSNESIQADIKEYEDSIKTGEKPKEETKIRKEK